MLVGFFLVGFGYSWWGHAHMIIGSIAETYLTEKENQYLADLMAVGGLPRGTPAEISAWQDDIKDSNKFKAMGNWHFSDIPIIIDPFKGTIPDPSYNVTSYLDSAWRTIMDKTTMDPWTLGFHLRSMVHFVGDVHTPHHNCALFSEDFPNSDIAGNAYKLNCNLGSACNNLHFFWDSAGFAYPTMYPMVPKLINEFRKNVSDVMNLHPASTYTTLNYINFSHWSFESFLVAKEYGYRTPRNEWPSKEFFKIVQEQSKIRIAEAGYRLGILMRKFMRERPLPELNNRSVTFSEVFAWCLNSIFTIVSVILVYLTARRGSSYDPLGL